MKNKVYVFGVLIVALSGYVSARINFGSRDSGFILDGGNLQLGSAVLEGGLIRDTIGNSLSTGESTCTQMTFELTDPLTAATRVMQMSGTVDPGTSIILNNNQTLTVNGAQIPEHIYVHGLNAEPSSIEGYGEFAGTIEVASNAKLLMNWAGTCNQNIVLTADSAAEYDGETLITPADTSIVQLKNDFEFVAPGTIITNGQGDCIFDCNGYKLTIGGSSSEDVSINNVLIIQNPYVQLSGALSIFTQASICVDGGILDGQGNSLAFFDNTASLHNSGSNQTTLKNIVLRNVQPQNISGSADWNFLQARIETQASEIHVPTGVNDDFFTVLVPESSLDVEAAIASGVSNLFCGSTQIESAQVTLSNSSLGSLEVSLNKDLALYNSWWFSNNAVIKGNGNKVIFSRVTAQLPEVEESSLVRVGTFIFGSSSISFENITLENVMPDSFNTWNGNLLRVSDVQWIDSQGQHLCITGFTDRAAEIYLPGESGLAGDLFANALIFNNGVRIDMQSDATLTTSWTFTEDSVIDGHGATFDVTNGSLLMNSNKVLTLHNMTLNGAKTALFSNFGSIMLSNVTIVLGENTTWNGSMHVTGPLTVVTADNYLHATSMVIDNGTAYYDTVGFDDINNFTVDAGRVMHIGGAPTTGTINISDNVSLDKNEYLFPYDDVQGRVIECTSSGVYNGHGRTLFFPYSEGFSSGSARVLSVAAGQSLVTTNMIVDGLVPSEHLDLVGSLYFGHDTLVRLHQDVTLDSVLRFGSEDGSSSEESMVLDLQGHTLDLGTGWINLYGGESDDNELVIRNGRILVRDSDILVVAVGNTLVFENVEIVLINTDWVHDAGNIRFEGMCSISGSEGNTVTLNSSGSMVIAEAATLKLCDGIVWSHSSTSNFSFSSSTSTLELMGATFRRPDFVCNPSQELVPASQFFLSGGRMIVDHKSYIQPGLGGIYLVDNLDIQLRPGASLVVSNNDVEGSQNASAGTLVYGQD